MAAHKTDLELLEESRAEVQALRAQVTAAQEQARQNFTDLVAARNELATVNAAYQLAITERDQARAELAPAIAERDTAQRELAAERETRETAIATAVTQRLAEAGPAPIARDPAAVAEPTLTSGLTGRAKAVAAINAQFTK